jgi:hypothetical protein
MAITGRQLRNVIADRVDMPGLRQAGSVIDLGYPPFFIDRVKDACGLGALQCGGRSAGSWVWRDCRIHCQA